MAAAARGVEMTSILPGQTMFDRELAASDAIELAAWECRSPALHVQEWLGRLWEYWL